MVSKINHFQDINVSNSNAVTTLVPNNNITHINTTTNTINKNNLLSTIVFISQYVPKSLSAVCINKWLDLCSVAVILLCPQARRRPSSSCSPDLWARWRTAPAHKARLCAEDW